VASGNVFNINGELAAGGGLVVDDQTLRKITQAMTNINTQATNLANLQNSLQTQQNALQGQVNAITTFPGFGAAISDVGSSDSGGSTATAAHSDHVHRGVTSLQVSSAVYGALTLAGAVSQSGSTFTIGFSGGLIAPYQEYADPVSNVAVTAFCSILTSNAHNVNFVLPSAAGNPNTLFLLGTTYNTAVPVVGTGSDAIDSNQGRGHVLYASNGSNLWRNVLSINLP
jgi:hypothetical protein